MINAILDIVKPNITALNWVHRYAGIAKTVSRERIVKDANNEYQASIIESFPIASDINSKQCWESGLYLDLVPNDKYKSVIYWEDLTGLQESGQAIRLSGGRGYTGFQATVRMVCWLNLKKLGYTGTDPIAGILQDAMKAINSITLQGISTPVSIRRMGMSVSDILPKDHTAIFSRYSYANDSSLFMYPFDYFAINAKLQIQLANDCIPSLTAKTPILC